ncbi:MAG: Holliday junction ATP-dependent DNA helicase RuvA [Planctomycetota bacterium]|nr:MAG: Holliday junction ATP-dependent DNA helicase RuvA [Planctomycetota bacterium]
MYDFLRGRLVRCNPTEVVLEVGGVGYRLTVPLSTYEAVRGARQEVTLLVHLVVREDDLQLYGFATEAERRLFTALIQVKGIGPAIAANILSGSAPQEIVRAIREGDTRFLDRLRGVGRKTAERVVVELREKAEVLLPGAAAAPPLGVAEDAVRALISLGYKPALARAAVERALAQAATPEPPVEVLVKQALQHAR